MHVKASLIDSESHSTGASVLVTGYTYWSCGVVYVALLGARNKVSWQSLVHGVSYVGYIFLGVFLEHNG